MKKRWVDPVKRPASEETMNITGDFGKFTDLMRKIITPRPEKDGPKPASSRVPVAS